MESDDFPIGRYCSGIDHVNKLYEPQDYVTMTVTLIFCIYLECLKIEYDVLHVYEVYIYMSF